MKHEVIFQTPARELDRSDVEFVVKQDGKNLGTLKVSRGSLVWFPGRARVDCPKLSWSEFDSLIRKHATQFESR